jgi:outer membrane protein
MSKNFSVVLNVILLIAVAFLYYAHYSNTPTGVAEVTDVDTAGTNALVDTGAVDAAISYVDTFVAPTGPMGIAKVAYVNIDIILRDYALVTDFQKVLATETKSAQSKVKRRVDAMQVEYQKMQEESRYWTQEQMAAGQARLAQMEQEVQGYEQTESQRLGGIEQEHQTILLNDLKGYLSELSVERGYDYVITYAEVGSPVLYTNAKFDITPEVLSNLNKRYAAVTGK